MKPLLLLHVRADPNTNDMWKAAISRGWSTQRVDMTGHVDIPEGTPKVRYYGNTLHAEIIADKLPIRFYPLDLKVLAETSLTKRDVRLMRAEELDEFVAVYARKRHFIKPAQQKWFPAKVYGPDEMPKRAQGGATLPSDLIYVQEPVQMVNEVRCFVLDGKIHTASYYRVSREYCPVPLEDIPQPLHDMTTELAPKYPRGVVLDFYYNGTDWGFLEPNEAFASGVYLCDYEKCLDVIEASQYQV